MAKHTLISYETHEFLEGRGNPRVWHHHWRTHYEVVHTPDPNHRARHALAEPWWRSPAGTRFVQNGKLMVITTESFAVDVDLFRPIPTRRNHTVEITLTNVSPSLVKILTGVQMPAKSEHIAGCNMWHHQGGDYDRDCPACMDLAAEDQR